MASAAQVAPSRTFSALRHSNFRWYFGGQLISISGSWMQVLAQGWLVFELTHSELALGVVAGAAGIPSILLSPFAGVVVDRFSRRASAAPHPDASNDTGVHLGGAGVCRYGAGVAHCPAGAFAGADQNCRCPRAPVLHQRHGWSRRHVQRHHTQFDYGEWRASSWSGARGGAAGEPRRGMVFFRQRDHVSSGAGFAARDP